MDDWQGARGTGPAGGGRVVVTIVTAILAVAAFLGYRGEFPGLTPVGGVETAAPAYCVPRPPLDPVAVADAVEPALVNVNASSSSFGMAAAGSGIVLTPDGQVLTSHHVVKGAQTVQVTLAEDARAYEATVLGYDSGADIALLSLTGAAGLAYARIGSSADVRLQDEVLAIGNAGGTGTATALPGRITDLDSTILALNSSDLSRKALTGMLEVSAAVSSGQSGGPVADHAGEVVGVIAAASGDREPPPSGRAAEPPNGYAVPIDRAMRVVRQIRSGVPTDEVHIGPTATLGVLISDASPTGARIDVAIHGLPAAAAGLADGEVITSLDGRAITTARALRSAINVRKPYEAVDLGIVTPSGQQRTVRVVLATGTPN